MTAADANGLLTKDEIASAARTLLADTILVEGRAGRHRAALLNFYRQWFDFQRLDVLSKDTTKYPAFDRALATSLRKETEGFLDFATWQGSGTLKELLTAGYSFVNERLGRLYGVSNVAGEAYRQTSLPATQRRGVLTQGAFLATHAHTAATSPVARGLHVLEQMLCQDMPPPPPEAENASAPTPSPGASLRDQLTALTSGPLCSSCHQRINPLGFAFETYDAIGGFRSKDEFGRAIDARGNLTGSDVDGPFKDAVDLMERLAASKQAHQCVVKQVFRFGYGRGEEQATDGCVLDQLDDAFARSSGNVRDLLIALTQTDAFRYRRQ